MVALAFASATIAVSCQPKLDQSAEVTPESAPNQVLEMMDGVKSDNGLRKMRIKAPLMEAYAREGEDPYEIFPAGFTVYGYNEKGQLETEIVSRQARHVTSEEKESWQAYGDVVVRNFVKGTRIDTDTLCWDREAGRIFTPPRSYVRLSSPDGIMQGYGLESDDMARNATLNHLFDGYAVIARDSTRPGYVDSVNFIGPRYKSYR